VSGYLAAKNPTTLRRNAVLLPWYQLLLFIPMMIGAAALFVAPGLGDKSDLALFTLVTDSLPAPVVAVIGVAGALSAIVPMSVFMLAIGTLWGKTVLGGGNGADPRSRVAPDAALERGRDLRNKRLSQLVCLIAGLIALAGSLLKPEALVNLSVLSYEGLAQLVPTVLVALFWRRMSKAGAVSGMLVGSVVMVALAMTGNDPLWGINGGLIALVPNVVVTVAVSLARSPDRTSAPTPTP
jgi:SSS family solute:Na+ symporter